MGVGVWTKPPAAAKPDAITHFYFSGARIFARYAGDDTGKYYWSRMQYNPADTAVSAQVDEAMKKTVMVNSKKDQIPGEVAKVNAGRKLLQGMLACAQGFEKGKQVEQTIQKQEQDKHNRTHTHTHTHTCQLVMKRLTRRSVLARKRSSSDGSQSA